MANKIVTFPMFDHVSLTHTPQLSKYKLALSCVNKSLIEE